MTFFNELLSNRILCVSIVSWLTAQVIKIFIEFIKNKRVDMRLFTSSSGMPNSHAAFVTAMATGMSIQSGFDSMVFAIAAVISIIVIYDAVGIHCAVGKHAESISILLTRLKNQGIQIEQDIKKVMGYRPIEVFTGGILGILVACLWGILQKRLLH